jgi:hypothetical protein
MKLYSEKNLTTYEIAQMFGCCQGTVWNRLRDFGIKTRRPCTRSANVPSKGKLVELYGKRRMSTWEIERKFGFRRSTVHRKLKEFGICTRDLSESHIVHPKRKFSGDMLEKAYLLGFSIGDLRVRRQNKCGGVISVECGTTKPEQIRLIENMFRDYSRVWISKPNKRGAINIGTNLDASFEFLLEKDVPGDMLRNKRAFFSFLAGFTDAEGHIGVHKGQAIYSLGNYNVGLLRLLCRGLYDFGIECRKLTNHHNKGYVGKDGYAHSQDYWSLSVGKMSELNKLFGAIEPYLRHEKRINDLRAARRNIIERSERRKGANHGS